MKKALAPLLFYDQQLLEDKKTRDPVTPVKPFVHAKNKKENVQLIMKLDPFPFITSILAERLR